MTDRVGQAGVLRPRFRLAPLAQEKFRGHAAPVDTGSTAQRYALRASGVKPTLTPVGQYPGAGLVDPLECLWTTG